MNVLIVDDNQALAEGLADVLDAHGYNVQIVHTVNEAREIFAAENFDFALLDMKLPDGSGLDLYYEFHSRAPDTQILVMTGFRVEQMLQQLVREGVVEVLRKPVQMNRVLQALHDAQPEGIVLIANDDPGFPGEVASFLADHEKKPGVARNAKEAYQLVQDNDVDVLILDFKKPILCGVEVYLELKDQEKVIPMIIVTGYTAKEAGETDDFRSISITRCLFKPFEIHKLIEAIENFTEESRS